ncbi:hypothetical protein VCHA50O407_100040 [Vibrio chagasii]|nr:hypothetical protein VCHA50O407_100040 [Vibrio chagasii]
MKNNLESDFLFLTPSKESMKKKFALLKDIILNAFEKKDKTI